MTLTIETVENLAPDQASLTAAQKLLKPAKWSGHGFSSQHHLAWAQCQGSGSKPYYTVIDIDDHGYKCTCPSRKFPCKHSLALMLIYINEPALFTPDEIPSWVADWLSRRRKTNKSNDSDEPSQHKDKPSLSAIEILPALSVEEEAKKAAAAAKRAEKLKADTDMRISVGLLELEQWMQDQLRMGLGAFLDKAGQSCRQIAARLSDAKAAALASRLDELPAELLAYQNEEKAHYVVKAFGKMVLLIQAWRANPNDADTRRAVYHTESRESLLDNPNTLRIQGVWQQLGEIVETRKDGLISYANWLVRISPDNNAQNATTPDFALLLDFEHAAGRQRQISLPLGAYIEGELCYYPSRVPLRAFFVQQKTFFQTEHQQTPTYPPTTSALLPAYQQVLSRLPWINQMPYLLPSGRIVQDKAGRYWWKIAETTADHPLATPYIALNNKEISKLLLGSEFTSGFILWQGERGQLISAMSKNWGLLSCLN